MKFARIFSSIIFVIAASLGSIGNASAESTQEGMTFIELHEVSDMAAARNYAKWAEPIMARHGGKIIGSYEVTNVVKGMTKPGIVWIYRFANEAGMQAVGSDPEYQANIPNRNKIFNFNSNQLFAVKSILGSN
jgi:uncharacterized protein (DUF1330 family)